MVQAATLNGRLLPYTFLPLQVTVELVAQGCLPASLKPLSKYLSRVTHCSTTICQYLRLQK
jgi:hypothetical protein